MALRIVSSNIIATTSIVHIDSLYVRQFAHAYIIREGRVSSFLDRETVVELFQDRTCTLRFRLVMRSVDGVEKFFDLTDFSVSILLKSRAGYNSDTPDVADKEWELTKEDPNTLGLCYKILETTDIPDDEGTYTAEIQLISGSDTHTFALLTVTVTKV